MRQLGKMLGTFVIVMACLACFLLSASADTEVSISVDKPYITLKNGEKATVIVHVDAPEGESTAISGEYDNKNICTVEKGRHSGGDTELTITGNGMGVSTVSAYVTDYPEIATEITVDVSMSPAERKMIDKVKYISDRSFFYYENGECYVLLFGFKDEAEERIAAPAKVEMRIENGDEIVYEKTHYITPNEFSTWTNAFYGERYLASVAIDPADIADGSSSSGNVYFTVTTGDYYFDESKVTASQLPKVDKTVSCSLELPSVPKELSYSFSSGKVYSKVNITNISYEFTESYDGTMKLSIYFTGQKTYDNEGGGHSSPCQIGWKLYDADGYVVKSGTCYTTALEKDEKFKNCEESIYSLEPGIYSLKLANVG